jgi:DNA repair exonuclease SbcCD ATPase subunit
VNHYEKIQKEEKDKTKKAQDELKTVQDQVSKIEGRLKLANKRLRELWASRRKAKTPAEKENITKQIDATQKTMDRGNEQLGNVIDEWLTTEGIQKFAALMKLKNGTLKKVSIAFLNAFKRAKRANVKIEAPDILNATSEELQAFTAKVDELLPKKGKEAGEPEAGTLTGKPAAGKSAAGKSAAGKSAAGKSAAGKSAAGKSAAGKSANSKYVQGYGGEDEDKV